MLHPPQYYSVIAYFEIFERSVKYYQIGLKCYWPLNKMLYGV